MLWWLTSLWWYLWWWGQCLLTNIINIYTNAGFCMYVMRRFEANNLPFSISMSWLAWLVCYFFIKTSLFECNIVIRCSFVVKIITFTRYVWYSYTDHCQNMLINRWWIVCQFLYIYYLVVLLFFFVGIIRNICNKVRKSSKTGED